MVAKSTEGRRIRLTAAAKTRRKQLLAAGQCLGCERKMKAGERITRGLCLSCYQATRHAVKKSRITDEALIRGQILPASPGGPKPVNDFTKMLAQRLRGGCMDDCKQ